MVKNITAPQQGFMPAQQASVPPQQSQPSFTGLTLKPQPSKDMCCFTAKPEETPSPEKKTPVNPKFPESFFREGGGVVEYELPNGQKTQKIMSTEEYYKFDPKSDPFSGKAENK